VRKSFGDAIAEDLRYAVKAVIGEENFVDMYPNKSIKKERLEYGKIKDQQIKDTGATYVIAACHNCHAQIHELSDVYESHYQVVHFWSLLALSLGILGPNERAYLGDDLKDVWVFHPETEM